MLNHPDGSRLDELSTRSLPLGLPYALLGTAPYRTGEGGHHPTSKQRTMPYMPYADSMGRSDPVSNCTAGLWNGLNVNCISLMRSHFDRVRGWDVALILNAHV
jgi:hypothetical protein